jgi:hypothetical protein
MDMDFEAIDGLQYMDEEGEIIQIGIGGPMSPFRFPLRILKRHHHYQIQQGDPIRDDWMEIMAEDYDDFRVSHIFDLSGTHVMQRIKTKQLRD